MAHTITIPCPWCLQEEWVSSYPPPPILDSFCTPSPVLMKMFLRKEHVCGMSTVTNTLTSSLVSNFGDLLCVTTMIDIMQAVLCFFVFAYAAC